MPTSMPFSGHGLLPNMPFATFHAYLKATDSTATTATAKARASAPAAILDEIRRSGLRGRGGAGFPTGVKWGTLASHPCATRYVVCNAAEGEPGTFKDRFLLRANPYAVIEGLLIASHVIGAKEIYIGIKASFTRELVAIKRALEEMAELTSSVAVNIVEGPDEYLFGEEKALLNVIEGEGPLPREADDPPYEHGLFATPTSPNPALVNNAETFAHVSTIVRHGAESFRKLGTSDTPGTLLITLSGDIPRSGVYEVEAGISVRTLLEKHGGLDVAKNPPKAVMSGVSSGVLLGRKLDTPVDFGSLQMAGTSLGSAGFMVIGPSDSVPRVAQTAARFLYVESCNQCSACKQGLGLASSAIDELFDPATASRDDWERALIASRSAPQGNRCYLPVQGALLLPSLLESFKGEFDGQLDNPALRTIPWQLPKIADFVDGRFVYDEAQSRKRPDWTYAPQEKADLATPAAPVDPTTSALPGERAARPGKTGPSPSSAPRGRIPVHLPEDLAAELRAAAQAANLPFDRQVEAALRAWLKGTVPKS